MCKNVSKQVGSVVEFYRYFSGPIVSEAFCEEGIPLLKYS